MRRSTVRVLTAVSAIIMLATTAACAPEQPAASPTPVSTETSPAPVPTVVPAVETPTPSPGLCDAGTLVAVWAHYDDDLIFGHSAISDALEADWCVTIAYLTAGDAGRGLEYSRNREAGIRVAYETLRGYDGNWIETADTLHTGVTTEQWTPAQDPRFTLMSFRLVDGNLDGSGFASMGYESMAKLAAGDIPTIRDVDGPQHLTRDDITHSLIEILVEAEPTTVLTHIPREAVELARGDHSDHSAVGSFMRAAAKSAGLDPSVVRYAIGYQTEDYPVNVTGEVLERKVAAFSAYARRDPVTADCHDLSSCLNLRKFGAWLQREYARGEAELGIG